MELPQLALGCRDQNKPKAFLAREEEPFLERSFIILKPNPLGHKNVVNQDVVSNGVVKWSENEYYGDIQCKEINYVNPDVTYKQFRFDCIHILPFWCEITLAEYELSKLKKDGYINNVNANGRLVKNSKPVTELKATICLLPTEEPTYHVCYYDRINTNTFFITDITINFDCLNDSVNNSDL